MNSMIMVIPSIFQTFDAKIGRKTKRWGPPAPFTAFWAFTPTKKKGFEFCCRSRPRPTNPTTKSKPVFFNLPPSPPPMAERKNKYDRQLRYFPFFQKKMVGKWRVYCVSCSSCCNCLVSLLYSCAALLAASIQPHIDLVCVLGLLVHEYWCILVKFDWLVLKIWI